MSAHNTDNSMSEPAKHHSLKPLIRISRISDTTDSAAFARSDNVFPICSVDPLLGCWRRSGRGETSERPQRNCYVRGRGIDNKR
uniref:Uncharacterized protein n=1 Tax=Panagrellus redivivus TaxID=6233 RepID=A0A7E4V7K7_PANRE